MPRCRHCNTENDIFLSLGELPLANTFLKEIVPVKSLPLNLFFCRQCSLMQLEDVEQPENIFNDDFKYFSSYSQSLISHSRDYSDMICERLKLDNDSKIVEIASNDGYLLDIFLNMGYHNILGIEPSGSVAKEAMKKGIPTIVRFFDDTIAQELSVSGKADLIIANNVIAHVPNINSFAKGIATLLKDEGTATIEFQYVGDLLSRNAFDMIYHEHFSYMSIHVMDRILSANGLFLYDVERLKTQGGSLRVYVAKKGSHDVRSERVAALMREEEIFGIKKQSTYTQFAKNTILKKQKALFFLNELKSSGKKIVCYGAAAKGSTFLNYLSVDNRIVDYVVDQNREKQHLYMAGCGLRVYPPEYLAATKPDYVWILPWNIQDEIISSYSMIKTWGGKFLVMMPEIKIL